MRQFCQKLQDDLLEIKSDSEKSEVKKARQFKIAAKEALLALKEYIIKTTFKL